MQELMNSFLDCPFDFGVGIGIFCFVVKVG
jgi:hypothetical protein